MQIKQKKNRHPKPDIWKYKEAQSEWFIEQFKNEVQSDIIFKEKKHIAIVFIGDLHLGNKGTWMKKMREDAKLVAKCDQCYVMLGGDYIDGFIKAKIMSALVNKDISPNEELALFEQYLKMLDDKVILAVRGNHDSWMKDVSGIDCFKKIFKAGRIMYSDDVHKCNLSVHAQSYLIKIRHKYRMNSTFNLTHCVKQMLRVDGWQFDVGIIFHNHDYAMESFMYGEDQFRREVIAIKTGSYKVADAFARKCGYLGNEAIMPIVVFNPDKKRMTPFSRLQDGIDFLKMRNK
jgi:predicted MPP superfamily phosphohydrolase